MSEEDIKKIQAIDPGLANRLMTFIIEQHKALVKPTNSFKQKPGQARYGKGSIAPYYNKNCADSIIPALNLLKEDPSQDVVMPYKMLGLGKATARTYCAQACFYIQDFPDEFDDPAIIDVAIHTTIRPELAGVRFSYHKIAVLSGLVRVAKQDETTAAEGAEQPETVTPPILNYRTKIEEWLETSPPGDKCVFEPLKLSDAEVLEMNAFLTEYGGLTFFVRPEKITILKLRPVGDQVV